MRTVFGSTLRPLALAFLFIVTLLPGIAALPSMAEANSKYAGFVIDAKTGKTLYAKNADALRYPASLTKMMTMYMMFDAMQRGKLKKSTRIRMSRYAASRPPSKIGLRAGRSLTAEQAIYALATKSANDVATAVAEHLGGSEPEFARMMTRKARALGMRRTTFKNASGLTAKGQLSTARDMAQLGIALREHFPQYYRYFSATSFKFGKKRYRNHNRLLGRVKGVDGIKTGYTRASGFNLVSSVKSGRRSIVAVVMGGRSGKSRNAHMRKLIAKYLPKARPTSRKKLLVASRKSINIKTAWAAQPINLKPSQLPIPTAAPREVAQEKPNRITVAHDVQVASLASATSQGFRQGSDFDPEAVRKRLQEIGRKSLPVPEARPSTVVAKADPIATNSIRPVEPVAYAPQPGAKPQQKVGGWQIQIGATDSREKAIGLLEKARAKSGKSLKGVKIYTETVVKNETTLFRARFAGFSSKKAATRACRALKAKRFDCLALNNG